MWKITDSLQYLVEEFHVDGFCFTNASSLVTGPHGQELSRPVLVEAITFDPLLAGAKLIVDSRSPINGVGKVIALYSCSVILYQNSSSSFLLLWRSEKPGANCS